MSSNFIIGDRRRTKKASGVVYPVNRVTSVITPI